MKLKTFLIGAAVVILIALSAAIKIEHAAKLKERAEKVRWQNNYAEQAAYNKRNTDIVLKQDEFINQLSDSLKNVLDELKIRPTTITRIIEKTNILRDTTPKEIPVSPLRKDEWKILDQEKCWMWEGIARIVGDSLAVRRVGFNYENTTIDIYHRKLKWKFLFIKVYSRTEIEQTSTSECGSSTSRTINILR